MGGADVCEAQSLPGEHVAGARPELLEAFGLWMDEVNVADLRAQAALHADVMNVAQLIAGVDVMIRQVGRGLAGVFAQAYLYVELHTVVRIVNAS